MTGAHLNTERKKRKARSTKERVCGAPLYIVAGVLPQHAAEVEQRTGDILGRSLGGEVIVPHVAYRAWYSEAEVLELFRVAAKKVVVSMDTAVSIPTPSAVFLLYAQSASSAQLDVLLKWFNFWAWPDQLQHISAQPGIPCNASTHWIRDPLLATEGTIAAARSIQASESRWQKVSQELQKVKNPMLLPPVNFRFPNEHVYLREVYANIVRGTSSELPRLQRVVAPRILGNHHFRDACGRFYPPSKRDDGMLRELSSGPSRDEKHRLVWLNGAYRFGCWVGNRQEHYDLQRVEGDVSPPPVYCANRDTWAYAQKAHVNVFHNDCVRDNDLFANAKTQQ